MLDNGIGKLPKTWNEKTKRLFHRLGIPLPAMSGKHYTNCAIDFIKENFDEKFS